MGGYGDQIARMLGAYARQARRHPLGQVDAMRADPLGQPGMGPDEQKQVARRGDCAQTPALIHRVCGAESAKDNG